MRKKLTRERRFLYHYVGPKRIPGAHEDLINCANIWGNCGGVDGDALYACGDVTHLWGDISGLIGNVSSLHGPCTFIHGDCNSICGNLSDCNITEAIDIKELIDEV